MEEDILNVDIAKRPFERLSGDFPVNTVRVCPFIDHSSIINRILNRPQSASSSF